MKTRREFGASLAGLTAGGLALANAPSRVFAQANTSPAKTTLTIGLRGVNTSIDPHFQWLPSSMAVNSQIFEALVRADEDGKIQPLLADSWTLENETSWLFKLRRGVTFSDGTPFTAEDVAFTFTRARNVPNTTTSFGAYLIQVKETQVVDAQTIRLVTLNPAPTLLENLVQVLIVSKKNGDGAQTADYHSGKAMIGTGPYKLESWTVNDSTVLTRNPTYWGAKPAWERVTYKVVLNDSSRMAALLAGDLDVMQAVPPELVERMKTTAGVRMWSRSADWLCYTAMDVEKALEGGQLTGPNDEKLEKNPLADARVRQALRLAIDCDAIATKLYSGEATPAGQYVPPEARGYNKSLVPVKADVERAKQLLKEAGWENGFKFSINAAAGYFSLVQSMLEAIAQSWTRIGVKTEVKIWPPQLYAQNRLQRKITVFIGSYQNPTNGPDSMHQAILHTRDTKTGAGVFNFAFYSNPEVDRLLDKAQVTMDDSRWQMHEKVAELAVADWQTSPLLFFRYLDATRQGITLKQRVDNMLMPSNILPS